MDELLKKLLEQVPVIIALGIGIYALWKERAKTMDDATRDKKAQESRIDKMIADHKAEIKELNAYVREREVEHLSVMKDVKALLEQAFNNESD